MQHEQSAALFERAKKSLAGGVSTAFRKNVTPTPLYFERGEGPYLFDVDGNRYVDYALGWGPLIVGNQHPRLTEAIHEQLASAYTFGAQHSGEIALAEKMVQVLPGVEQVIFSNTGTEAVQAALRLARGYTGRDKIIKFEGHYHGWLNNVLVSNHPREDQWGQTVADCGGQPAAEYELTLTCPWNDLAALESLLKKHTGEVAAVLTEPILVNCGSCMPQTDFLPGLIELCRRYGAVSIFDEVITGFRLALGGAREFFNVQPDLSVYAKAMAGGFSMSAVGGRAEVLAAIEDGRTSHFGTYNGNPVSVSAALATINILSAPGVFDRMHHHGFALREAIENAAQEHSQQLVTTGVGSAFHVHFGLSSPPMNYRDTLAADTAKSDQFRLALVDRGIYSLPGGRWYVGATHRDEQLALAFPAIDQAIATL